MKHVLQHKTKLIFLLAIILMTSTWIPMVEAEFGDLQAGARSMGMGGAFVAIADDASAALYNPAGIGEIQYMDVLLNYTNLFAGLTNGSIYTGYAGLVIPTNSLGNFGVGFYQRGSSVNSKNLFNESVIALTYARKLNRKASIGIAPKILMNSWNTSVTYVDENPYFGGSNGKTGMDMDFGLLYRPFENLALGFAVENLIAADMAINSAATDKIDRVIKPGIAFHIGQRLSPYVDRYPATIVADVLYKMRDQRESVTRFQFGAEGWLINDGILGLRVGFSSGDENHQSVTLGASFRLTPIHPGLQLDYGFQAQQNTLEDVATHRFALRFNNVPVVKRIKDREAIKVALVAEPNMFSPNNDGRMDILKLRPLAPTELGVQSWSVKIYTQNTGDVVRTYEGEGLPPLELTWRGQDDNGMKLPDGEYYGVLEVLTAYEGVFSSANTQLILDTVPPEVNARAVPETFMPLNADGSLPNATAFKLLANDALTGTEAWSLYIRKKGEKDNIKSFTGRGVPADDVIWNGNDENNFIDPEGGIYVFVLEAVDKVGNRAWTDAKEVYTSTMFLAGSVSGTLQMVTEKIFFDFDKATIKPESYSILDRIVRELEKFKEYSLVISAHTDNVGTDQYNLDLSQRRAESVMEYLKNRDAIRRVVEAKGYGESRPIDTNETDAGRARNRRVELVLVPRG